MTAINQEKVNFAKNLEPVLKMAYISAMESIIPPYIGEFSIDNTICFNTTGYGYRVESFYTSKETDKYSISIFCKPETNGGKGSFWIKMYEGKGEYKKQHQREGILENLSQEAFEKYLTLWRRVDGK